ncbi:MAG: hypothetical protein R2738_01730 [Bacteroides graminisolvens]
MVEADGDDIKVTLIQNLTDAEGNVTNGYTVTGKVTINPDAPSMKFEFPLVNYAGGAGAWLNSANPKGSALDHGFVRIRMDFSSRTEDLT